MADFTEWVADHHRPLFGRCPIGREVTSGTGGDLLQIALARAYLKWSTISARGGHPQLGHVRRIIVNENASALAARMWKRGERSTGSVPEAGTVDPRPIDTTWGRCGCKRCRRLGNAAAMALRFCADLSVTETAEVMGVSVGSVKTQGAGLAKLRADAGRRRWVMTDPFERQTGRAAAGITLPEEIRT